MSKVARQLLLPGQINLEQFPTTSYFWGMYESIKEKRQKTQDAIIAEQKLSPREQKINGTNHGVLKKKLNAYANLVSGIQILDALEGNSELKVKDMQWEFYSKDAEISNFQELFDDLVIIAGGLDSVPHYLYQEIMNLGSTEFYKKYSFLMGTTLSLRLDNNTKKGLYFCIPFRSIKIGYLAMYLKECTVIIPDFVHDMKRSSDECTERELVELTEKYFEKASYIVEQSFLPKI